MKITKLFVTILYLLSMVAASSATVAVKVFSFEEAQTENNLTKPRILIKNVGNEAISNIEYRYYFTTEGTETPVIEDYWTPEEQIYLISLGSNRYYVNCVVSGTLQPGLSFPENSGCVIGIHYNSWAPWNKSDDYSNNLQATLTENSKIDVFVNGVKVYGNYTGEDTTCQSCQQNPPPADISQLSSFALYSTNGTNVVKNAIFSGGGALGSNGNVEVAQNSTVWGNLVAGNSVIVRNGSVVHGNVYAKQDISVNNGAVVDGNSYPNTQVAAITIPERIITVGSIDKTVNSNDTLTLQPGNYRYCYVNSNAKLFLLPGIYKFDKFVMYAGSKMEFNAAINQNIEIEVNSELEIHDRCEVKFLTHGYAPAVKFFTNDNNTVRIGVNAKITGLIYAPKANLLMSAGSRCDGAVYAKQITIEDGAGVSSGDVNPLYDQDHDGVPNRLEILTYTNPEDPLSFKMMAIPDKVNIDNTVDQEVTYNLAKFAPEYSDENQVVLRIPAGSLIMGKSDVLWKISNSATDFNNISLTNDGLPTGYSVESRFFSFEPGTFKSNAFIDVVLPVIDNSVGEKRYSIYYLTEGAPSWCMTNAVTNTENGVITVSGTVKSPLAMVIVAKRDVTTAYLDGSVFVDGLPQVQVSTSLTIENVGEATTGTVVIEYIDKANPSVTIPKTITMENTPGLDNTRKLTGVADYNLIRSAQQIEIRKIQITTNAGLSYTWTGSYTVDPGIEITLRSSCPAHYYTASQSPIAFESASNFALESIDLDGEGRARYTLDGSGFTYDYYITDHLGSTREIVNSTGDVTEATMYYPYGTMDYLKPASSTDNAREKFTGKELDAGENPTGEATFDIRITNFDAGSMHYRGELWVNYIDASTTREMLKVYSMFYNPVERSFTLNTTERFPTEVWITRLQIFTSGATTPIAYDITTYNYRILTDHGLTVKLDTDGANLINNPATNYFGITSYTPVRVAGSNLFYFGARYYDPEVGVWTTCDPKGQFLNPYHYSANPINSVDPNGEWVQALFAAARWYLGNSMSQGFFNPGKWDWSDPGLWMSTAMAAFSVGMDLGNDFKQLAYMRSNEYKFQQMLGDDGIALLAKTDVYLDKSNTVTDMRVVNDADPTVSVHKGGKVIATGKEPPRASYFYNWNHAKGNYSLVANHYRFAGDWSGAISNIQNTGDITAPYSFKEWGTGGAFDFKKYYPNQFGNAWGYMMTSRDVGNAMWGSAINRIYYVFGGITEERMTMISNFVAGGTEDPFSLSMQQWGYRNSVTY